MTKPSTRGSSAASSRATTAPLSCARSAYRERPTASIALRNVVAWDARSMGPSHSLWPVPGRSNKCSVKVRARAGTIRRNVAECNGQPPMLRKALAALDEGDTLMVVRLDRLARATRDLLNILHEVGDKGASFKSL